MKVALSEVIEEMKYIYDLYPVQFKGVYIIPNSHYTKIAIVTYCEYEKTSYFITEISIGKGSMSHYQYQTFDIPCGWIRVHFPQGDDLVEKI